MPPRIGWPARSTGPISPIRLAAIADANTALAEDAARRYGYEKALSSWEAVAEDPSIDAVSIVVGNALHRPISEALVAAGKHVLCEKPLAGSMEDARAMVALEQGADVVTAVGYTLPPFAGHRGDPGARAQPRAGGDVPVQRPVLVRLRAIPGARSPGGSRAGSAPVHWATSART